MDRKLSYRPDSRIPTRKVARALPIGFTPGDWDIICHAGKDSHEHIGNRRFDLCIENHAETYTNAKSRTQKTVVISTIVESIREASGRGGFVRFDTGTGGWYEIGDKLARDKVGHSLRKFLSTKKKGSSKSTTFSRNSAVLQYTPETLPSNPSTALPADRATIDTAIAGRQLQELGETHASELVGEIRQTFACLPDSANSIHDMRKSGLRDDNDNRKASNDSTAVLRRQMGSEDDTKTVTFLSGSTTAIDNRFQPNLPGEKDMEIRTKDRENWRQMRHEVGSGALLSGSVEREALASLPESTSPIEDILQSSLNAGGKDNENETSDSSPSANSLIDWFQADALLSPPKASR